MCSNKLLALMAAWKPLKGRKKKERRKERKNGACQLGPLRKSTMPWSTCLYIQIRSQLKLYEVSGEGMGWGYGRFQVQVQIWGKKKGKTFTNQKEKTKTF